MTCWPATRLLLVVIVLALAPAIVLAHAEPLDSLTLGPGDRLAISVFKRPDLSAEPRIQAGGEIGLPYVGTLLAAGLTLPQLRAALTELYKTGAFLIDPRVTVEVVEFRPITVAGAVRRPGDYPFQPGITVRRAIALAGGSRATGGDDFAELMEVGRLRERLRQTRETIGLNLVRRERFLAEQADKDDFLLPDEARSYLEPDRLDDTYKAEATLLRQRNAGVRAQLEVLDRQIEQFGRQTQELSDQNDAKAREAEVAVQESEYTKGLIDHGLIPRSTRYFELERLARQLEGERHQIAAYIATARQDLGRAEQTRAQIVTQQALDATNGIKDAVDTLAASRVSLEEIQASLDEAGDFVAVPGKQAEGGITIRRSAAGAASTVSATQDTALLPGDLVDIPRSRRDTTP